MSTSKEKIVPGTIVVITCVENNTNIYSNKSPVFLTKKPGGALSGGGIYPNLGDEITILEKPKKHYGINCVKVKFDNEEYYAYYCSIRYMTTEKQGF
jgi:hypothetical protein